MSYTNKCDHAHNQKAIMLTIFDVFLTANGIVDGLQRAQNEVMKLSLTDDKKQKIAQGKLTAIKTRLQDIYFNGLTDEQIVTELASSTRFLASSSWRFNDYPRLKQVLDIVFVNQTQESQPLNLEQMLGSLSNIPAQLADWAPSQNLVDNYYETLNEEPTGSDSIDKCI